MAATATAPALPWKISEGSLKSCVKHVRDSVEFFKTNKTAYTTGYRHNTSEGSLVGVKCELAVTEALKEAFPNCRIEENYWTYRGKRGQGDIDVFYGQPEPKCHCIEVKGLRDYHWDKYKRCVTPGSLKGYVKRDSFVVWCSTKPDENCNEVVIRGWNYATELEKYGVPIKTICDNVKLKDDFVMHDFESLVDIIKTISVPLEALES